MFDFFSKKLYTFTQILSEVKEDETLYIGESEVEIRKGSKVRRVFEVYNPYQAKKSYIYVEKEKGRE